MENRLICLYEHLGIPKKTTTRFYKHKREKIRGGEAREVSYDLIGIVRGRNKCKGEDKEFLGNASVWSVKV